MTLDGLYRAIFGRKGLTRGTDIDMSEHGRVGGLSTEQGFKLTREVDEKTLIDEASATVTYIGKSRLAGDPSAEEWQIKRVSVSGTVTTISFADNTDAYTKEWDERANYSY